LTTQIKSMMSQFLKYTFLCCLTLQVATAQIKKTEDFTAALPAYTTQSNFGILEYIDSRKDTASYGIVQKGAFNKKALVQPKIPISQQFQSIFASLKSPETTSNDTLVIQLRDMKFAEVTEAFKETGYFYLRAVAYFKSDGKYYRTFDMDLVEEVNAMDVTQKNYKNASRIISDFIAKAMKYPKDKTTNPLTFNDVLKIEQSEKRSFPLYANEKYVDGLYTNYSSFRDQTPNNTDFKIERNKKEKIKEVTYKDFKGNYVPISIQDTYAVVENGIPYIATSYGYYELLKVEDDFYYVGRTKNTADNGTVVAATLMFGIIGGFLAADSSATYEVMIDHLNGTTILKKKVKN